MRSRQIFTIGHSNHPLARFLDLLAAQRIEVVADVRSNPWSRFAPHFNRDRLEPALTAAGVRYLFLGDELGGRPQGDEFYDEGGHVLYGSVAATDWFVRGIARVEVEARVARTSILCSEENPSSCHRRLLVARVLEKRGAAILHVRGDGSVIREDDLKAAEGAATAQTSLFDAPAEETWRSTQSVSRRRALATSSRSSRRTESSA
jgi:uncharacterized protein (DUF488 family)